jgi:hypothetical protein
MEDNVFEDYKRLSIEAIATPRSGRLYKMWKKRSGGRDGDSIMGYEVR